MIRLRDLLPADRKVSIEYRMNSPKCWQDEEEDMLYGICSWDGKELFSDDGDNYYLNDVIEKCEWKNENYLIVWIEVVWSSDRKENDND